MYEGSIKEVEKLRGRNGGGRETVGILDAGRTPGYGKSDSYEAEADRLYEEVYKLSNQVADFIVSLTSGQIDKVMAMTMMRQRREDVERILEAA